MIMKKLVLTYNIVILSLTIFAQQLPLHSQYMFNKLLINPAYTGTEENLSVQISVREQWIGFDNAPTTQYISAHQFFEEFRMGLGAILFTDKFAHESQTGLKITYSYQLPVYDQTILSMGLDFQASWLGYDYREIIALDYQDPNIYMGKQHKFFPEADIGFYLFNEIYNAGISVNQLLALPVKIKHNDLIIKRFVRQYNLFGSYRFNDVAENFDLEPGLMFKTSFKAPSQLDVNIRAIYEKNYWYGLSLRSNGDIVNMIGLRYKDMSIGFSIDIATSRLFHYQSGSVEAYFIYHIPKKIKIISNSKY